MSIIRPYCLSIAGFDPSGGAGVIADCKTFEQLKVHGLSVVTANTAQTEDFFANCYWTEMSILKEQIELLLNRYPIRFIKIGLMRDTIMLLEIVQLIKSKVPDPTIVWDPILRPTHGGDSFDSGRFQSQLKEILDQITIITPNIPEFERLFGNQNPSDIAQRHSCMIYLKGGHSHYKGKDILHYNEKIFPFRPRIQTGLEKHGTGCIFSSALTALLARKHPLIKSCLEAKEFVEKRIVSNTSLLAYYR